MRKLPEIITEEELIKLITATKKKQHKLAFALGFYEAMRISEIIKLKPENIDKQTKLIRIIQAKGSKDRNIPIAPEILPQLKLLPFKFKSVSSGSRSLQLKFKALGKEILGKDLHFHCLRHSGITHYLTKKKWSSLEVQRLAGHSRVTTTEIYSHINPTDLVNKMWGEE
jgi:integrase/recombinase XerD